MSVLEDGTAELHLTPWEALSAAHSIELMFPLPLGQKDEDDTLRGLTLARTGDVLTVRSEYFTDATHGQRKITVYLVPDNARALARELGALADGA